jgi:hypothetical protein
LRRAPDALYQMIPVLDELARHVISYRGIDPADGPTRVEFKAANGVLESLIGTTHSAPKPDTGQTRMTSRKRLAGAVS